MQAREERSMSYTLQDEDYLELWKYFEDRADNIKEAMFKTLTWIVGYAAALLGFIFLALTNFDRLQASVPLPSAITLAAAAGLVICLYSWFMLSESAKHIQRNWQRSAFCLKKVDGLTAIVSAGEMESQRTIKIWDQLRIIVVLFALGFGFLAVLAWTI
jgi:hypothetical protein